MIRSSLLALLLVLVGTPALAQQRVFINDVNVGAVRDLRLRNCTVDFDAAGDIRITAPDYVVRVPASAKPEAAPAAPLDRKYWLTTEATPPGATQFDFYVWVNGTLVRTIRADESGLVVPLNQYLQQGKNSVGIKAVKRIEGARVSRSASDRFTILIGEGVGQGETLTLRDVFVRYNRTAADMSTYDDLHTIVVQ